MTDREKLVGLLESTESAFYWSSADKSFVEKIADHLITNGVTFEKDTNVPSWIPVSERLPELHTKVLCCGIRGGRFIAELTTWGNGNQIWDKRNGRGCPEVTHWMPLPEPPKEEKDRVKHGVGK